MNHNDLHTSHVPTNPDIADRSIDRLWEAIGRLESQFSSLNNHVIARPAAVNSPTISSQEERGGRYNSHSDGVVSLPLPHPELSRPRFALEGRTENQSIRKRHNTNTVSFSATKQHSNETDKSTHIQADATRPPEQLDGPEVNTSPNTSNIEYPKASTVRSKKRIRKPTRNADGILIRKDGMPDRRGKILRAHETTRLPSRRHSGEERARGRSAFWRVVDFAPDLVRTDER
ncbi:hypothetical protein B0J12DRAFT_698666 [Macrophomina phaseolina]|uniref:Uncharacterized protein n=1 Tax=Macrophomina phaseolina TaxID=35725 RepID=A0ABQ8GET7_9PEZI|nr:hypothetical protein B0J12DRAFT_698666 [Macrophomina phaseolina]